jgi:16S rRNA (uracil1498-N3)-methyltransferase
MALRRFYISPEMAAAATPAITGSDAGHICRVLRLGTGDCIELFDGSGTGYRAKIVSGTPACVHLAIEATFPLKAESGVRITLAQAMLKERKMDDLLRPLTELGMDCWMPFYAARSIPAPGGKGMDRRMARWGKIALEAVKQCRRGCIPRITPMENLAAVLDVADGFDLKLIFWEETAGAFRLPPDASDDVSRVLLVIGPEGGFTSAEVRRATARGCVTAGLGPRILRAQTAALAAFALVQYCLGDMGPPAPEP